MSAREELQKNEIIFRCPENRLISVGCSMSAELRPGPSIRRFFDSGEDSDASRPWSGLKIC
jgi:hypothetical protein